MHGDRSHRGTVARALAVPSALVWAVPLFGVIDLTTVVVERGPEWRSGYLLEAGWGLMFAVLVAVPFLVLAVRPGDPAATGVLAAAAVALLAAAAWAGAVPVLLAGIALVADAAAVAALGGVRRPATRPPDRALVLLGGLGAVGAVAYGHDVLSHPTVSSVTVGVEHHGVQAALGLAVAGCTGLAAVTAARLPAWCAVAALAWLSVLSLAYPDVDGSLGGPGALAGAALAACIAVATTRAGRAGAEAGPGPAVSLRRAGAR